MKKNLPVIMLFIAVCLLASGAVICSAQMIVGNYRTASKTAEDVVSAANFAVGTENEKRAAEDAFKLNSIEKAETQVVAGTNFRLCLEVESRGEKEQATVVVYRNLKGEYSLTSWTGGNCGSDAVPKNNDTAGEAANYKGTLEVGATNSLILYVGAESGDYAAFCFPNDSAAGRKILASCKNGAKCEFTGKVDYAAACQKPANLEANLSASGKILSVSSIKSFAAKRTTTTSAIQIAPDALVRNLYAAHNAKRSPFFQAKSRALVDKYFTKEFADLIWKDAVSSKDGVGVIGADPLYNAQDTRITLFKIGKPEYGEGNLAVADVPVTFKNMGKAETILFRLEQSANKSWKISDIFYPSNEQAASSLKTMLMQ